MKKIMFLACFFWVVLAHSNAHALLFLSDIDFAIGSTQTKQISFNAAGSGPLWFQVKQTPDELGSQYSAWLGIYDFPDPKRLTINWLPFNEPPPFVLPHFEDDKLYSFDPYDINPWPTSWYYGVTPEDSDDVPNWNNALAGQLSDIHDPVSGGGSAVPEPASLFLLGGGILAAVIRKRRLEK